MSNPTDGPLNLLSLSLLQLESLVATLGWKPYRALQIWQALYRGHIADIAEITNLSRADRDGLAEKCTLRFLEISKQQHSADGTQKFLVTLEDGCSIESVLIPDGRRRTLCISSQVGCTLDCMFCLTAQSPLRRNLKAHEITGQVLSIQQRLPEDERITHIVFMGQGEPLANLSAVTEAMTCMTSQEGMNFSPRRITLSTAGLVPQMIEFLNGPRPVNLSISLNATTDEVRSQIMPAVNRLYPLATLLAACEAVPLPRRRRITFEYVLLAGINDALEDAARLVRLVHRIRCKVNLIRFNPSACLPYECPAEARVLQFQRALQNGGLTATLRKRRGADISAACGQLNAERQSVFWTSTGFEAHP